MDVYLELQESRRPDRAFAWLIPLYEKKLMIKRGLDKIIRGDLLYYEMENGGIEKVIYDGKRGCKLLYGRIPASFQAITEFPVTYWQGRLDNRVPFDFAVNVEELSTGEIMIRNNKPYFELETEDKTVYTFTTTENMSSQEFRDKLRKATYFKYDRNGTTLYPE